MLTVADKGGGEGSKPSALLTSAKYLNFGKNCFKSSGPISITMRETTALIYSPKLMAG